jgi:hypothetical protein
MAAPAHIARENGKKGGRPKGSTTRPQIRDFFTPDEIKKLIDDTKKAAETDNTLKKFLLEMIYGKAPQQMEISGPEGEPSLDQGLRPRDRRCSRCSRPRRRSGGFALGLASRLRGDTRLDLQGDISGRV